MAQANQADFLGEGTVDPFAGLAPATPEEQQALEYARRARLRQSAQNTANINLSGQTRQTFQPGAGYFDQKEALQEGANRGDKPDPTGFFEGIPGTLEAISRDPLTMGILAAPYGVLAGGAALGGLSSGGAGSLVGSSAAPVGYAAESAPFAMASPSVAAPASASGATAAGTAAAGAAPSWLSGGGELGKDLAIAAAPLLINEALGGRTKEEKALVAKQEQLAREAQIRQGQQQDARMNQLGQQLLAFNPTNQRLAQMFGPSAAFTPEQMAGMVQGTPPPALPDSLVDYRGVDPNERAKVDEWIRRKKEFDAAEANRRSTMLSGTTPVGPGPAPIQMSAPQAARRF